MLRLSNDRRAGSAERQELAWGDALQLYAAVGEESVADDLGLLLEAVAAERLALDQPVPVAGEGVPHQRQVEAAALLRLPDMGHLVDEEALSPQRLAREIIR